MISRKTAFVILTFIATLNVAGLATFAVWAGASAPVTKVLDDVRVGERGNQTRIVFICKMSCALEKSGAEFLLRGAPVELDIDLSSRSQFVDRLYAKPTPAGAMISVAATAEFKRSSAKNCIINDRRAVCLDLYFAGSRSDDRTDRATIASNDAAATKRPIKDGQMSHDKPALAKTIVKIPPPTAEKVAVDSENRPTSNKSIGSTHQAERLEPPQQVQLASIRPVNANEAPTDILRDALSQESRFDFAKRLNTLIGKELSDARCQSAEKKLQEDAWALDAMVNVGLCAAASGEVEKADELLARLLDFTPDNYEALVGRALIAEQAGEISVAKRYYQDALTALPPIEESNRIVEAMRAL